MDDREELLNSIVNHVHSLELTVVSITHLLIERGHLDRRETAGFLRQVEELGRTTAADQSMVPVDLSDMIRIAGDIEQCDVPQGVSLKLGS